MSCAAEAGGHPNEGAGSVGTEAAEDADAAASLQLQADDATADTSAAVEGPPVESPFNDVQQQLQQLALQTSRSLPGACC